MNSNSNPNPNGKPFDLGERCVLFAKRILEICEMLPDTPEGRRIRGQLGAAGTSVGANYEEGDGALTKKDKRKSFTIARKEARESQFFLKVISGKYLPAEVVAPDIQEAEELKRILSSIIDKLS